MTSFNSYVKLPEGMFCMFFSHTFHPLPTAGLVVATWSVAEPPELQHQAGRFFVFVFYSKEWGDENHPYMGRSRIYIYIFTHMYMYTCILWFYIIAGSWKKPPIKDVYQKPGVYTALVSKAHVAPEGPGLKVGGKSSVLSHKLGSEAASPIWPGGHS